MKRNAWLKRITEATRQAGTYKPYFDAAMETLAGILEKRDEAEGFHGFNQVVFCPDGKIKTLHHNH